MGSIPGRGTKIPHAVRHCQTPPPPATKKKPCLSKQPKSIIPPSHHSHTLSSPERTITATTGLCTLTFTLLLFPTGTATGKNSLLAVSIAWSCMEGTSHCTLSDSSISLHRQLSYTTDRAEKPQQCRPMGASFNIWIHSQK